MSTPSPTDDRAGYVYVLAAEDGSCYKIGRAKIVDRRILQMKPNLPFKVRLVMTIKTSDAWAAERNLHEYFAQYRRNGEWFALPAVEVENLRLYILAVQAKQLCVYMGINFPGSPDWIDEDMDLYAEIDGARRWLQAQQRALQRLERRLTAFVKHEVRDTSE